MTNVTKEVKMTMVDKVLNFLKSDDKTSVSRVLKDSKKIWTKEIKLANKAIAKAKEDLIEKKDEYADRLVEANEKLAESYLNINISRVKGMDEREEYIRGSYQAQISEAIRGVERLEEELKTAEDKTKEVIERKEQLIELYNKHISAIS